MTKGKKPSKSKEKKAVPQESDTPPSKGLRKNNATVSLPHTPVPVDNDDNEANSSLSKESADDFHGPEVNATSIATQDPPLALAPALMPIME